MRVARAEELVPGENQNIMIPCCRRPARSKAEPQHENSSLRRRRKILAQVRKPWANVDRDVERRRCDTRDLIACVTLICYSMPSNPGKLPSRIPDGERMREGAGEGSAPLPPQCSPNPFYDLVMLSEARIGIDYPYSMARSRSIPRILTALTRHQGILTRLRASP